MRNSFDVDFIVVAAVVVVDAVAAAVVVDAVAAAVVVLCTITN